MHVPVSLTLCACVCVSTHSHRYGLYGSPFDPVLFDLEVSGSSCKNSYSSSIGVQSDEIDLSDILSGTYTHSRAHIRTPVELVNGIVAVMRVCVCV